MYLIILIILEFTINFNFISNKKILKFTFKITYLPVYRYSILPIYCDT